jgi:hypothetical protein
MPPGFSANTLATVVGLGAAAISLFAAWIITVPPGQLSVWVRPALIVGASLFFVLALATAVSGLLAWRRYPATIVVVEGRREVIIGFWDAVDLIQKRTRYGEDGWVRYTEEEYLQVVRERLLSDFKEGYVALFGRLPHASAYRRIDRPEFADMYFDEEKAILYRDEAKTRPHRVEVAASYRHVKQCIQRMRGKAPSRPPDLYGGARVAGSD